MGSPGIAIVCPWRKPAINLIASGSKLSAPSTLIPPISYFFGSLH